MANVNIPQLNGGVVQSTLTGAELLEAYNVPGANVPVAANSLMFPIVGDISLKPSGDVTGATDTATLLAYSVSAAANVSASPGYSSNVGSNLGVLHAGDYYVNTSILDSTPAAKATAFRLLGRGMNETRIHYTPSVAGTPLIRNKRWLNMMFEDISFIGNDPTANFFNSLEQGGLSNIQENIFTKCAFTGSWLNIMLKT